MLVCAHPAIGPAVRTPLMLNTVLGFTAEQVGRAFSVPTSTMATRLVRAKKRIKAAGIPFRIPDRTDLPARMASVLEAVYGAYVIDWATGPQDRRLPSEALHLAEVLTDARPRRSGSPRARGPGRALGGARAGAARRGRAFRPARRPGSRAVGPAPDQPGAANTCGPRTRAGNWGGSSSRPRSRPCTAPGEQGGTTDWPTLLTLHRLLHAVAPSLGSSVALAAVTAEVDGPAAGLAALDALLDEQRARTPASSSRPGPPARTCLTGSDDQRGRRRLRKRDQPDPRHRRAPVPAAPRPRQEPAQRRPSRLSLPAAGKHAGEIVPRSPARGARPPVARSARFGVALRSSE